MDPKDRPADWLDTTHYIDGINSLPLEVYMQYAGKHVAVSPDGTRILASGDSHEEVDRKLDELGIPIGQVVHDYFDALGETFGFI
jgi:hypothetical protein